MEIKLLQQEKPLCITFAASDPIGGGRKGGLLKHLTNDQYIKIIQDNKINGIYADNIFFMRQWDEVRTDINPDATWYPFDTDNPKEMTEYISRAAVVKTLIAFAKEIYENENLYEPIIEAVIDIESRISDLPTIMIENEVTANDEE